MLEVVDLRRSYGSKVALDGLSLSATAASILAVLGANGAGKTTMMRVMAKILRPDSGKILWRGQPIDKVPSSSIGYLPEISGLYAEQHVQEQLEYFTALRCNRSSLWVRQRIHALAERLSISQFLHRSPRDLSKGTLQKCNLLAALAHAPEILLLDEPFSGLDPESLQLVTELTREQAQQGAMVILSTHRIETLEDATDQVCILQAGRVVKTGKIGAMRQSRLLDRLVRMTRVPAYEELLARFGLKAVRVTDEFLEVICPKAMRTSDLLKEAVACGPISHFEILTDRIAEIYKNSIRETASIC